MRTRTLRSLLLAALAGVLSVSVASAQTGKWKSSFFRDVAYHVNIPPWTDLQVDDALEGASLLISEIEVISQCGDAGACVSIERYSNLPTVAWGSATDGHEIIDSPAEAATVLMLGAPTIKIVAGFQYPGQNVLGTADSSGINMIISETAPDWVWAHEFGHNQGLPDNPSCGTLIMCSDEQAGLCALDRVEVAKSEVARWEANPDAQKHRCTGSTPALLRYFVAYMENGSCKIRFRTDVEVDVSAFKLYRRVLPADTLLSVTTMAPQGGDVSVEYIATDPQGNSGDTYYLFEDRVGLQTDMYMDQCIVTGGPSTATTDAPWWNADSLNAVFTSGTVVQSEPGPCSVSIPQYAIFCPDAWRGVASFYARPWRDRFVDVEVVTLSRADSCFGGVKEYISYGASHGLEYALLMGDASDFSLWDDPTAWVWPGWHWPQESDCSGGVTHPVVSENSNTLQRRGLPLV